MDGGIRPGDGQSIESATVLVQQTYDWSATSPSIAAIHVLAAVENVDPVELATDHDTVLYDHVNPEALDAVIREGETGSVAVTLSIDGYRLRFAGDELIVTEPNNPSPS